MITDSQLNTAVSRSSAMMESNLHDIIDRLRSENDDLKYQVELLMKEQDKLLDKIYRLKRINNKLRGKKQNER